MGWRGLLPSLALLVLAGRSPLPPAPPPPGTLVPWVGGARLRGVGRIELEFCGVGRASEEQEWHERRKLSRCRNGRALAILLRYRRSIPHLLVSGVGCREGERVRQEKVGSTTSTGGSFSPVSSKQAVEVYLFLSRLLGGGGGTLHSIPVGGSLHSKFLVDRASIQGRAESTLSTSPTSLGCVLYLKDSPPEERRR